MIDETLYRETFSRLRASDEAKEEVLLKMNEMSGKKMRRPWKILRTLVTAAALTFALAVTANAASGGELLDYISHEFTIIWSDGFHDIMVDEEGNEWDTYNIGAATELRDGRLYLQAMTQEVDITDELTETGEAVHTFYKDGYDLTVTVTGTMEEHTIKSSSEWAAVSIETSSQGGSTPEISFKGASEGMSLPEYEDRSADDSDGEMNYETTTSRSITIVNNGEQFDFDVEDLAKVQEKYGVFTTVTDNDN